MMKAGYSLVLAGLLTAAASARAEVPVIEVRDVGRPAGGGYAAQPLTGNAAGNEMVLVLQQLQDEVRSLRGIVEQQQRRIEVLERQQRDRYRDVDRRLSLLFQAVPADALAAAAPADAGVNDVMPEQQNVPSSAEKAVTAESTQMSSPSAEGQASAGAPPSAAAKPEDLQAYEAVYALIRQRDFERANGELNAFISAYPDSTLIPNAWYWKGEVQLARQDLDGARKAFRQVIDNHASHGKAADALYKLGVLYGRSGDGALARQTMQQVISTYPQSSAADLARGYLTP